MSSDVLGALTDINLEKGVSADYMKEKILKAIYAMCRNVYGVDDPIVNLDSNSGNLTVKFRKKVVEKVDDEQVQVSMKDALTIDPSAKLGDILDVELDTKQFGRIAAQTARSVIKQGIREGEKEATLKKLSSYENEIITAQVVKINWKTGFVILVFGKIEAFFPRNEKIPADLREGQFLKVYILKIETTSSSVYLLVSRSCPEFIKKLFESEVPEIADGTVVIKAIAREVGFRTKIAVFSNDPNVEAVGACIGNRGSRIELILEELAGEKIDIIKYHEDLSKFVEAAVAPASVVSVEDIKIEGERKRECSVVVNKDQLSLAIGAKGQNVRLASKLTFCKINLIPENVHYGE
ncbi:MAG: transcription termination factor NusA [Firmicutes bacterium]|nr:transcription termination factor NusA [Bacillota bacterium]